MRIVNEDERDFYEVETVNNHWSVRELTLQIILCKDKKDTIVEITLPENNKQIYASKYELILPSKMELKKIMDTNKL